MRSVRWPPAWPPHCSSATAGRCHCQHALGPELDQSSEQGDLFDEQSGHLVADQRSAPAARMGVHIAFFDTGMILGLEGVQKAAPLKVGQRILDGVSSARGAGRRNRPTNQAEPEQRYLSAVDYAGLRLWRPAHSSRPLHGNWRAAAGANEWSKS